LVIPRWTAPSELSVISSCGALHGPVPDGGGVPPDRRDVAEPAGEDGRTAEDRVGEDGAVDDGTEEDGAGEAGAESVRLGSGTLVPGVWCGCDNALRVTATPVATITSAAAEATSGSQPVARHRMR